MRPSPRTLLLRLGFWLRAFWLSVGVFHLYLFLRRIAAEGWDDPAGQIKLVLTLAGSLYAAAFSFKVEKWAASLSASPRKLVALGLILVLAHIDPARQYPLQLPAANAADPAQMLLVPALAALGLLGLALAASVRSSPAAPRPVRAIARAASVPRRRTNLPASLYLRQPPDR